MRRYDGTPGFRWFVGRFLRAEQGAVAIYVSLTAVLMLGFGALVIDLGRTFNYQTELQKAVDASALAAAAELDGTATAITRARLAAKDALVNNRQTFGAGGPEVDFADSDIRFLHSLPASDDDPITSAFVTTDPGQARFVEVRASARTIGFFLAPVFAHRVGGGGGTEQTEGETSAVAVAGYNQVVCGVPPMMICNPAEAGGSGADFNPIPGMLIHNKSGEDDGTYWAPGNFGLLDAPNWRQECADGEWGNICDGTEPEMPMELVQEKLARASAEDCTSALLDTRTGSAQEPVSTALNVRFDMYENPGFKNDEGNSDYLPAPNVTKGKWLNTSVDPKRYEDYTGTPPNGMGMPTHPCFEADNCDTEGPLNHERIAPPVPAGQADQEPFWADYWSINHPSMGGSFWSMATLGDGTHDPIDANGDGMVTRTEMYDWEIAFDEIPANVPDPENDHSDADAENGNPMNYSGGTAPHRDRREFTIAVVNCVAQNVRGQMQGVRASGFMKVFFTRPVEFGGGGGLNANTMFVEVIRGLQPGVDNDLHDIVQLYR